LLNPAGVATWFTSDFMQSNHKYTVAMIGVSLAAIVWLVFGQTLHQGFVNFDDPEYVYKNPVIKAGLTANGIHWVFTHKHAENWHPLSSISHMLDCQVYGLSAGGHHFTSVLLHTATVILLFLVLRTMTGALWPSAFVAAVFAIHPLRVESVAWVSERKDVLSGLFFMLTLGAYARYAREPGRFNRYLAVLGVFALGLMSKPMLVTVPFILLYTAAVGLLALATVRRGRGKVVRDTPAPDPRKNPVDDHVGNRLRRNGAGAGRGNPAD
jgi:hypothetical protein